MTRVRVPGSGIEADVSAHMRCSFCGKTKDQARILIAGTSGALICDECVGLCGEIVAEQLPFDGKWGATCDDESAREAQKESE